MAAIVPSFNLDFIDTEINSRWNEAKVNWEKMREAQIIRIYNETYGYKDAYFETVVTKKFDGRRAEKKVLVVIPGTSINKINFSITLNSIQ